MSEGRALGMAGAAHIALIAALSLGWSAMQRPMPAPDAIAVDLTDIADAPTATERPREASAPRAAPNPVAEPTPPLPLPAADAPVPLPQARESDEPAPPSPAPRERDASVSERDKGTPAPTEVPTPKPKPSPKPAKLLKPAPDPDALARSLDDALARPPRPARPARPTTDPTQLASLLDRALARPAAAPPRAKPGPTQTAQPANAALDARATATLVQAIRAQIVPCWNVPAGSDGMTVDLHIRLARDGSVAAPIEVRAQSGGPNPAVARAFAESARRAVARCAPLKLPAALYDQWRDIDPLHFDPKDVS